MPQKRAKNADAIALRRLRTLKFFGIRIEQATHTPNPSAIALGMLGAQKGGIARAKKLSAAVRSATASNAAKARWTRKKNEKLVPEI